MSKSPLAGQVDISTKLDKSGGIYTGLKEAQDLTNTVTGAGQTIDLDYANQTQYLNITTDDAFTITFSNWPTTEAGYMSLIVDVALGVTVGTVTWPTTKNTPSDLSAITPDDGEGRYVISFGNGAYRVDTVEES